MRSHSHTKFNVQARRPNKVTSSDALALRVYVIYKKTQNSQVEEWEESTEDTGATGKDDDSDSDEEEGGFVVGTRRQLNRNQYVYGDVNLKNVIDKVRKIVKFFRKSPTKIRKKWA